MVTPLDNPCGEHEKQFPISGCYDDDDHHHAALIKHLHPHCGDHGFCVKWFPHYISRCEPPLLTPIMFSLTSLQPPPTSSYFHFDPHCIKTTFFFTDFFLVVIDKDNNENGNNNDNSNDNAMFYCFMNLVQITSIQHSHHHRQHDKKVTHTIFILMVLMMTMMIMMMMDSRQ